MTNRFNPQPWFFRLSLRGRLTLLLSGLIAIVILFSAFLLFEQHQLTRRGADLGIQAQQDMMRTTEMRETLSEIDHYASFGEVNGRQISRFRDLMNSLANTPQLLLLRDRFESYVQELDKHDKNDEDSSLVRARFDDLSIAVESAIAQNQESVYQRARELKEEQTRGMQLALSFLVTLVILATVTGAKLVTVMVRPLTSLTDFMDQIRVEDDLPTALPHFQSEFPEISHLSKSFEQLIDRLRGYRTLNVKRLLIEKRQSDIIAAAITDAIILLRDEEILYLNPIGERILGLPPGTISRGFNLGEFVKTETKDKTRGARAVLSAVAQTIPFEFSVTQDDRKLSYLITAAPISLDLVEQMSHHAPVEEVLERFQPNTLVVARDITIMRESQEAKSHFLGTLSHEVKTPVTSLTMATRLMKRNIEQIPSPAIRSLIETCVVDADRLRKLLEDLLTVTRFDTLAHQLEMQNIDLAKLVKHEVQSFQTQASEKGIQLIYKTLNTQGPVTVAMDPTKITWALGNLITNALRHTPKGGEVTVQLEASEDRVDVKIRDTGPGIERVRQERIFDKFNPFYDIRVARSGSTGASLAIAREIVVAHGGTIWVASEPGSGAEFCFTLPLKSGASGLLKTELTDTKKGASGGATTGS